ncbi:MAG: hypothetical protein WBF87_01355 [Mesorhizobium sp.]
METASEIWINYVRFNLIWVFIAGVLVIMYRSRDKAKRYRTAVKDMSLNDYRNMFGDKGRELMSADASLSIPIVVWLVVFGLAAMAVDMLLGPQ